MTLTSVFLVVFASFIHATWNLLSKRSASVGPIFVFAYNVAACVAYAPWVFYLLVRGDTSQRDRRCRDLRPWWLGSG
ncbi:hypothetical protein [Mesorhizobium sp. A623]